ncbi:hypothetical protein PHYSODRAFT_334566 [Phytophthora sojae]|uniref:Transposase Tc1-like domain-containing protein n=1 Tax=Phytophthora sojae (strain P6497) TaxID=1094619 RepID=G4ZPX1_PHYSP|nr:hypothetical protein PHYSODRAFT_334566 [Phytophthora sojae]EGZ16375.1 hypothetical protein PHYSODRAFT_334566 [Phytophthora sojae]|eukprot:XP_009530124.1 hypothetical protein PHYSODRAFT_334566 [Phytophthora sojae]
MPRTVGAKDITPGVRVAVVVFIDTLSKEGRLPYGTIVRAKKLFKLSRAAVETIWGLRGDPVVLREALRALEAASAISRSTLHRHLKSKVLRHFIWRVKPALTGSHKLQRLTWALAQVQRPIDGAFTFRTAKPRLPTTKQFGSDGSRFNR